MNKMPQLIALLFDARNKAHQAHLQTTSYAQHKALDEYYNSIIDLADSLAENHQGRFGIITQYPTVSNPTDPIMLITTVRSWIDSNRAECGEYSEIQNIIDEVQSLNNSTLYKLNNLK
jgi:hypothetical protein